MRLFKLFTILFAAAILAACAHPISISPSMDKLSTSVSTQKVNGNAAYIIAADILTKEVTTPGGGGDKVSYQPYRDIEPGFYKVLSNVFSSVTKLKSITDSDVIAKNHITYVITPTLITNSSSTSIVTWPPTKFTTELTCKITDESGKFLMETKVTGNGVAEFDEFKKDFSLSARRASEDALQKLQRILLEAPELKK